MAIHATIDKTTFGGISVSVRYNKLWKLLIDHGMTRVELKSAAQMSPNTLAKLGKNEDVSLDVLKRICGVLQCDIGDIMEIIPDVPEQR